VNLLNLALGALVAFALLPELVRFGPLHRGSPRVLATLELAGLVGWAILPVALLSCFGDALATVIISGRIGAGGCWMGVGASEWRLLGVAAGGLALTPLVWQGYRTVRAVRDVELKGLARQAAQLHALASGGSVWVLPSPVPTAYAAGVLKPTAVVTSAVLDPLGDMERQAVLEHEAAHVKLGHPRLIVLAAIIVRAYGMLPPVSRGWHSLRRELEAAADDEAVRSVGREAVLSALAQVALAQAGGTLSFGESEYLRYRISRLEGVAASARAASAAVVAVSIAMVGLLAWTACVLVSGSAVFLGELACVGGAAAVASRPLWAWHRAGRSGRRLP